MPNIIDYAKYYGIRTFEEVPFNDIDALILDECTSGLDNDNKYHIDACDVLEYIVKYSNKDKKRIVIISTHQNIDKFKNDIKNKYEIRNFKFTKKDNINYIKEF